ncbi:MAG: TolC family protein [Gemmatimonadetes bacterium]|nr:TolC family protein [Gemmatimonadota bacterium]
MRPSLLIRLALVVLLAAPPLAGQQALTLTQAIALAQSEGYQARSAEATRDAAVYRERQFHSGLLPQLSLNGTVPAYNRSIIEVLQPDGSTLFRPQDQTNANLNVRLSQRLPTGGDLFVQSTLSRFKVSGGSAFETWSSTPVTIGLRQDLFRPNTLKWDRREQDLRGELAERQYREAREDIAVTVTGLYFDAYSARVSLQNAETNVGVNDTLYTLNKGRFEVGKIGENDLLQSELALLRARNALDGSRLQYDRAMASLRLALNLPIDAAIELTVPTDIPVVEADTAVAVREAMANRAAVRDVALQRTQAERSVNAARLNTGFAATVQASYGYNATGTDFRTAYDQLQEARQFSLGVQLPLWQWGARGEGVAAARADQERVVAQTEATIEQTAQEAHFAALELAQARRSLEISAKADTVAGKRFEVAYNRYVIGRIDIDNLYVAQSEKDQALNAYVQALRGYWQAYYRLRRVTLYDFATGERIR